MKVKAIKAHVYSKARNEGDIYEMPEKDVETMVGLGFIEATETATKGKAGKGKSEESKPENPPVPEPEKTADPNSPKDLELK